MWHSFFTSKLKTYFISLCLQWNWSTRVILFMPNTCLIIVMATLLEYRGKENEKLHSSPKRSQFTNELGLKLSNLIAVVIYQCLNFYKLRFKRSTLLYFGMSLLNILLLFVENLVIFTLPKVVFEKGFNFTKEFSSDNQGIVKVIVDQSTILIVVFLFYFFLMKSVAYKSHFHHKTIKVFFTLPKNFKA